MTTAQNSAVRAAIAQRTPQCITVGELIKELQSHPADAPALLQVGDSSLLHACVNIDAKYEDDIVVSWGALALKKLDEDGDQPGEPTAVVVLSTD